MGDTKRRQPNALWCAGIWTLARGSAGWLSTPAELDKGRQGLNREIQAERGVALAAGDGRIWGMTGAERLQRTFQRAGLNGEAGGAAVLARADWVYDESLIAALARRRGGLLIGPQGQPLAAHVASGDVAKVAAALEGHGAPAALDGLTRLDPAELAYNEALRKREPPVLEPLSPERVRAVEARLFKGSYKGGTDLVT